MLSWIAQGKRNAEIAVILGSQPRTVSKHVENVLHKLGVEDAHRRDGDGLDGRLTTRYASSEHRMGRYFRGRGI